MTAGRVKADGRGACPFGTPKTTSARRIAERGLRLDEGQAVVLSEVGEVLGGKSRERQIVDQAACGDPCAVVRPGSAP